MTVQIAVTLGLAALGCALCVLFLMFIIALSDAFAEWSNRRAMEADAGRTFARDFIPQVEDVATIQDAMPDMRGRA